MASSVRERRKFSKRKSHSLGLDIAFLLLGSLLGIAGVFGIMLALDHFGHMEKPYIWVAIVPLLMTYWLANLFRRKLERRLNR